MLPEQLQASQTLYALFSSLSSSVYALSVLKRKYKTFENQKVNSHIGSNTLNSQYTLFISSVLVLATVSQFDALF